jgi:hypothetical protein
MTTKVLSKEEQEALEKDVFYRLINVCKLDGIDYMSLDKAMQAVMLSVFQEGMKYVNEMLKERGY